MKLKKLFHSASADIILEDFKKYLFVSLLGVVAYILMFIGPLLMQYKKLAKYSFSIENFLSLTDVSTRVVICLLPLVSASLVFKYLQNKKESIYIHSLPFKRTQLFISKFVAGLAIGTLPVFITWICLHILAKPVINENFQNIFSHGKINMWLIGSLLYFLIIYSISVFSCVISGNLFMQLVSAIGIGCIPYALYRCSTILYLLMIKGTSIDYNDKVYTIFKSTVPFNLEYSIIDDIIGNNIFIQIALIYVVFSTLIVYFAYTLYNRRKLEKTGEMIVFSEISDGLLYISAYCSSIILPVIGQEFFFGRIFFTMTKLDYVLLFWILSIICFVVGAFIIYKTIKIFEKTSKKNVAIFLIAYAVLLLSLSFDVLKIEQKIPDIEDISYIESDIFQTIDAFIKPDIQDKRFDNILFAKTSASQTGETVFKEKENIKAVRAAHKDVIKDLPYYNIFFADFGYGFSYFKEGEKGSRILKRVYMLNEKDFRKNKNLKKVFESNEFKDKYRFNSIKDNVDYIKVSMIHFIKGQETGSSNYLKIYDPRELEELINKLDSDLKDMSYESFVNRKNPICSLKIGISNEITSLGEKEIFIYPEDRHILELLEAKSYLDSVKVEADNIEKIVIKKVRLSEVSKDFNSKTSRLIKEDWTTLEVYEPQNIESLYKFFNVEEIDNGYSLSVDLEIYFKERDIKVDGIIYCPLKNAPEFLKESVDMIEE